MFRRLKRNVTQPFINYNFLGMRFHAWKIILGARPCMWEIVQVKSRCACY